MPHYHKEELSNKVLNETIPQGVLLAPKLEAKW